MNESAQKPQPRRQSRRRRIRTSCVSAGRRSSSRRRRSCMRSHGCFGRSIHVCSVRWEDAADQQQEQCAEPNQRQTPRTQPAARPAQRLHGDGDGSATNVRCARRVQSDEVDVQQCCAMSRLLVAERCVAGPHEIGWMTWAIMSTCSACVIVDTSDTSERTRLDNTHTQLTHTLSTSQRYTHSSDKHAHTQRQPPTANQRPHRTVPSSASASASPLSLPPTPS